MRYFRWTDEKVAEMRRQMNLETTYVEIARILGTTESSVISKAYRLGWTSAWRAGFLAQRRNKGKPVSKNTRAASIAASKARWQDPEIRKAGLAILQSEAVRAKRIAASKRAQDRRRGFAIPDHLRPEYDRLLSIYRYRAREAGAILGLIPNSKGA